MIFAMMISGAHRLPNGNTLVCSGPDGTGNNATSVTLGGLPSDIILTNAAGGINLKYQQGAFDIYGYAADSPPAADVAKIGAAQKSQLLLAVKNKTYWASFNLVADARRPAGGPFTLDRGKASHDMRLAFSISIDSTKLAKEL